MKSIRLSDFYYDLCSSWFTADVLTFKADETSKTINFSSTHLLLFPCRLNCIPFRSTYIVKIHYTPKIVNSYIANQSTGVHMMEAFVLIGSKTKLKLTATIFSCFYMLRAFFFLKFWFFLKFPTFGKANIQLKRKKCKSSLIQNCSWLQGNHLKKLNERSIK